MLRPDHLQRAAELARARLDRLGDLVPERNERMPFEEYIARASLLAQDDPQFAARLRRSMSIYRLLAQRKEYP